MRGLAALGLVATLFGSDGALARGDSCHQWADEHRDWTVRVVRLYLTGGGRHELDTALFELLQREAYLTSCDTSLARARGTFVGWRLTDRTPDEYAAYAAEVVETLLVRAGFPTRLRELFGADVSSGALALRAPRDEDGLAPTE
jgi:hypothetical protein